MGSLDGKTALITGAGGGLGAACVRRLVDDGALVLAADLKRDSVEPLAKELGSRCVSVSLDVGDADSWASAMTESAAHGALNVLINNAGVLHRTPFDRPGAEIFEAVVRVNQLGVFLGIQAALEPMTAAGGGSIINMSSIDGMLGMPYLAAYVASKWAVRGLTKAAAIELGGRGIRVNSVHPGYIDTPMLTAGGRMTPETMRALAAQVPAGRLGTPEDIAGACAFLASDESAYCNGAEIVVDGGLISGLRPT